MYQCRWPNFSFLDTTYHFVYQCRWSNLFLDTAYHLFITYHWVCQCRWFFFLPMKSHTAWFISAFEPCFKNYEQMKSFTTDFETETIWWPNFCLFACVLFLQTVFKHCFNRQSIYIHASQTVSVLQQIPLHKYSLNTYDITRLMTRLRVYPSNRIIWGTNQTGSDSILYKSTNVEKEEYLFIDCQNIL